MKYLYYLSYIFSYPILRSIFFITPGFKKNLSYKLLFENGYKYHTFKIYIDSIKKHSELTHTVVIYAPVVMVFCMILAIAAY